MIDSGTKPEPTMGAGFDAGLSYERDIAPLQQRFFKDIYSNRNIRPQDRAALSTGISQRLAGAFEQQAKYREIDQQARNRELSFRSGLFALDQAREKAAKERENAQALGMLTESLSAINDLSGDERSKALVDFANKNAYQLSTNDAARVAYDATVRLAPTPKQDFTSEDLLRMGVPFDELDTNKDGIVDASERTPEGVSRVLQSTRKAIAESEAEAEKRKADEKKATTTYNKQLSLLDTTLSKLGDVKFQKKKDPADVDGLEVELPKFADTGGRVIVNSIIGFGTPEEQKSAGEAATDLDRYRIAEKIQSRLLNERVKGVLARPEPAVKPPKSLFAEPDKAKPKTPAAPLV